MYVSQCIKKYLSEPGFGKVQRATWKVESVKKERRKSQTIVILRLIDFHAAFGMLRFSDSTAHTWVVIQLGCNSNRGCYCTEDAVRVSAIIGCVVYCYLPTPVAMGWKMTLQVLKLVYSRKCAKFARYFLWIKTFDLRICVRVLLSDSVDIILI